MSKRKTVGGDRLGSGKKLTTSLHGYERSTHDLGRVTRTSMTTGTLVPIFVEFMQKGDVWDLDLEHLIRTHPTNGPLFGTYKFQVDVFTSDVRLYNKQLHNNQTGVGLNMANIKFPMLVLNGRHPDPTVSDMNQQQISPDSLLAYTGVRGLGRRADIHRRQRVEIQRNAMPIMSYWDIFKEYYSNKQEKRGFVISPKLSVDTEEGVITQISVQRAGQEGWENISNAWSTWEDRGPVPERPNKTVRINSGDTIRIRGENLTANQINVWATPAIDGNGQEMKLDLAPNGTTFHWESVDVTPTGESIVYRNFGGHYFFLFGERYYREGIVSNPNEMAFIADPLVLGHRYEGIGLSEFPLSNIDDMRDRVFAQDKASPLLIGYGENEVLPYKATTGQTVPTAGEPALESNMFSFYPMAGLALKTYQSDRFNNWLNTEWIEAVNSISAVSTTGNSFTMDALNLAKKVYELENRIALSGATYQDWLEAVYGEKAYGAPEMPVYRGGMSSEIIFDEVVSNSDSTTASGDDQPLGTLAGRGTTMNKKGGSVRIHAQEHGYVIILASITPRIDYYQGNKWHTKLETMDDIHKPQLDSIGFQELLTDEMVAWDTIVNDNGSETFKSIGKQPSWTHYCTNWNEVYGNFARENSEQWMVLTRRYEHNTEDATFKDGTTYIDPTKFNYPFAYVGLDNQPFWVQVSIDAIVRRKMAANQIPNF